MHGHKADCLCDDCADENTPVEPLKENDETPVSYGCDDYLHMTSHVECTPVFMDGRLFGWQCHNHPQANDYAADGSWWLYPDHVKSMIEAGKEMLERSGDLPTPQEVITSVLDRVGPKACEFLRVAMDIIAEEGEPK